MGKAGKIKLDLEEVKNLLEIFGVLKDVATNRYYQVLSQKEDLSKFFEEFDVFFNMLGSIETDCPLIKNNIPGALIVVVTSEASFMSLLNSRAVNLAHAESQKYTKVGVVCVGWRSEEKCKSMGLNVVKVFKNIEETGRYNMAMMIRDFLIEKVMTGEIGRIIVNSVYAQNFSLLKTRCVTLLPAEDILKRDMTTMTEKRGVGLNRAFLRESSVNAIMKNIADIWISCRLMEVLAETKLAENAAQAQQLDSSIDSLTQERKGLNIHYKKALRSALNKAIREVVVASKIKK